MEKKSNNDIPEDEVMYVITRSGKKELLNPDKITERLIKLINMSPKIHHVNPYSLMTRITGMITNNITTYKIDEFAGDLAMNMSIENPFYSKLAARIIIDNHHRFVLRDFTTKMCLVYDRIDKNGKKCPLLSDDFYNFVIQHSIEIENIIDYQRDFYFDYFGFRTFQKLYGLRIDDKLVESLQDVFMRTAISLNMPDIQQIRETYDLLSNKYYTQASPTYFNAGGIKPQYASCFLLGSEDSQEGIMKTATDMSRISKWGGGIGIHYHNIRSTDSMIRGTNGLSSGIVPFIKIYNETMKAFNQGGKRMGSAAIYLALHHADIMKFLELKLNTGYEEKRAKDLFYAIWVPDLFMERLKNKEKWSLFNPDVVGDLSDLYDEQDDKKYTERYLVLEKQKLYVNQVNCTEIWQMVYNSNKDNGTPYICFSDHANRMSMQKHVGTIKSSNLCSEIFLYSDSKEYAVCNLASISLSNFVVDEGNAEDYQFPETPKFDFNRLVGVCKQIVVNLNQIIYKNYYPTNETFISNMRHRPIGIGIQGLADCFLKMNYAFDSEVARILNKKIMECIYYACLTASARLAREKYLNHVKECREKGFTCIETINDKGIREYTTYKNIEDIPYTIGSFPSMLEKKSSPCPISQGKFHWELYGLDKKDLCLDLDWETLRELIKKFGVRNSHLIALMPTASTSQLLGNNECFEPFTSNLFTRKTLAGEFIIVNKYLIHDLQKLGLWNETVFKYIEALRGSIQDIDGLPTYIKEKYKTAFEINPKEMIQQAIDRQPFVDQGQSLNWFISNMSIKTFYELSFMAWRGKLKTAKYYLRSQEAVAPQRFSLDPKLEADMKKKMELRSEKRTEQDKESLGCLSCSG